jgi:hypothetical protein
MDELKKMKVASVAQGQVSLKTTRENKEKEVHSQR